MKAYSNDLRRKIVAAYERGRRSQREIAQLYGVSPATISYLKNGGRWDYVPLD